MAKYLTIIGRAELLELRGIATGVPAKIDTGAYTSAIHCRSVAEVQDGDTKKLAVELLGHPCSPTVYPMEFTKYDTTTVTNSFGQKALRYRVMLRVKLGPKVFTTPFTLADRSTNLCPILAGRQLLKDRFVVDVAKAGIDHLRSRREYNIGTPSSPEDLE